MRNAVLRFHFYDWLHQTQSIRSVLDCFPRLIAEGGVFLFRDRQLSAVGECDGKTPDASQIVGVDEIALVTAKKQVRVSRGKLRDRRHDLRAAARRVQYAVFAVVRGLDPVNGVRKIEIIRPVDAVKMDALAPLRLSFLTGIDLRVVDGIDVVILMLAVGIGDMADEDARHFLQISVCVLKESSSKLSKNGK